MSMSGFARTLLLQHFEPDEIVRVYHDARNGSIEVKMDTPERTERAQKLLIKASFAVTGGKEK